METLNSIEEIKRGFRNYRKGDSWVDLNYHNSYDNEVDSIVKTLKQNIDQGTSITLGDLIPSFGCNGVGIANPYSNYPKLDLNDFDDDMFESQRKMQEIAKKRKLKQSQYQAKKVETINVHRTTPKIMEVHVPAPEIKKHVYTREQDLLAVEMILQQIEQQNQITINREAGVLVKDLVRICRAYMPPMFPIVISDIRKHLNLIGNV